MLMNLMVNTETYERNSHQHEVHLLNNMSLGVDSSGQKVGHISTDPGYSGCLATTFVLVYNTIAHLSHWSYIFHGTLMDASYCTFTLTTTVQDARAA